VTPPLLSVEEAGSGEPLVLLHGLATTRAIWTPVLPALARERRVVSADLPGFGESAPTGDGFELEAVAARIARGLSARGVPTPFDLVGHSLGAGVAITLAAIRPCAVRRLILVAPAGLSSAPRGGGAALAPLVDPLLAGRRALAALSDLRWGRRLLLGFAVADGAAVPPTQARMMITASTGAKRTAAAIRAITEADLGPVLSRLRVPLGVIWGAADRTVPVRLARVVEEARPDAELVVIERTGHVPMVERPAAFTAALEGLLRKLPKSATTRSASAVTLR
jgi:pimeloyl-ACP methyl ester carboxylesterase